MNKIIHLLAKASDGDSIAQLQLAARYWDPSSEDYDFPVGLGWLEKALSSKDISSEVLEAQQFTPCVEAMLRYFLGIYNAEKKTFNFKDCSKIDLLKDAAHMDHPRAYHILGYSSGRGRCLEHSIDMAIKYYSRAVELGETHSHWFLSLLYSRSDLDVYDAEKAYYHTTQTCVTGSANAFYKRGMMLLRGEGVSADITEAVCCLLLAASRGTEQAAFQLKSMELESSIHTAAVTRARNWIEEYGETAPLFRLEGNEYTYIESEDRFALVRPAPSSSE